MLLHHVYKYEWREIKKAVLKWYLRSNKQMSIKVSDSFKEMHCMNKYLLIDTIFIFAGTK